MVALKVSDSIKVNEAVEPQKASMPEGARGETRQALRKGASADSIEIVAGQTVVDPHTAMKMYLLGKLTQGQLSHELKKYNDVVADTLIKEGKENVTRAVDYREVGRGNIANPGGDLRHEDEHNKSAPPPKDAKQAKKEASNADDDKKKKEAERQETKLKDQEYLTTLRSLANFTETTRDQKNAHAWRELKKREEEKDQNQEEDKDKTSIEKAQKRISVKERLRSKINEELRKELDFSNASSLTTDLVKKQ